MADEKIHQLPAATTVAATDLMIIGDPTTGLMKKVTKSLLISNSAVALTDASTVTWDYTLGSIAAVTLGGNRSLGITGASAQSTGLLKVKQDATGGRTLTLPGVSETGLALSTGADEEDILAFYFDGTSYYWSISNFGVVGGGGGGPILEDLLFPVLVGTLNNTSHVWDAGSGSGSWNANKGESDKKLASGQDGYIQFQAKADGTDSMLAFVDSDTNADYSGYKAGIWLNTDGNIYKIDGGSPGTTAVAWVADHFLRVNRAGSVLKMQSSADGTSWTDIYTYSFSSIGDLFINMQCNQSLSGKCYNPKGYNLSAV